MQVKLGLEPPLPALQRINKLQPTLPQWKRILGMLNNLNRGKSNNLLIQEQQRVRLLRQAMRLELMRLEAMQLEAIQVEAVQPTNQPLPRRFRRAGNLICWALISESALTQHRIGYFSGNC